MKKINARVLQMYRLIPTRYFNLSEDPALSTGCRPLFKFISIYSSVFTSLFNRELNKDFSSI